MNTKNRLARAKIKAKQSRMERWRHGVVKNPMRKVTRHGAMTMAHGPGSINAESEMQQLVRSRQDDDAIAFYEAHGCIRGASKMRWGEMWYRQQKAIRTAA